MSYIRVERKFIPLSRCLTFSIESSEPILKKLISFKFLESASTRFQIVKKRKCMNWSEWRREYKMREINDNTDVRWHRRLKDDDFNRNNFLKLFKLLQLYFHFKIVTSLILENIVEKAVVLLTFNGICFHVGRELFSFNFCKQIYVEHFCRVYLIATLCVEDINRQHVCIRERVKQSLLYIFM
jgi:hypothetical protein